MSALDNASKFGKPNQNLVLETAGRIWVKVQDRFYELDFRNQNKGTGKSTVNVTNNIVEEAPEQDMSQYVTKNYLKSTLTEYVTKRAWADVKETTTMLENSLLEGFTESISPITVNTMQVVVGSDQLQYDFIENYNTTEAIPGGFISENGETILTQYHVKLKGGWIKHYTLDGPDTVRAEDDTNQTEIRSQYCRWHIADGEFDMGDSAYYVYIKVPRLNPNKGYPKKVDGGYILQEGGQVVDDITALKYKTNQRVGVDFGDAEYVLSTTAIEMDNSENNPDDSSYYYLLFAIINSPSDDGSRSYVTMNGFTEITPGRVTAYRFMSPDGIQYLNFLDKAFHLGDDNSYLHFDADSGELLIQGTIVQSPSGDKFPMPCYRGEFTEEQIKVAPLPLPTFYYGDSITYNGEVWLDIYSQPITGIAPGEYIEVGGERIYPWKLYSSKAKNNFTSTVFTRSASKPSTPTGGSYASPFPEDTDTFGNLIWSDGIPPEVADTSLWMSQRLFTEDGTYPQDAEWTEPTAAMDSADIDFEWSEEETIPAKPNLGYDPSHDTNPPIWSNDSNERTIWMAVRKKSNGVWDSEWNISKIKGEKGIDGKSPLTADLTDEVTGITVGSDGVLDTTVDNIEFDAHLFYGVDKQTITKIGITNTDSNIKVSYNGTNITGSITISDQDPTLHITIDSGWHAATVKIGITLYCSLGNSTCTHTIIGISEGEDGAVFKLMPSVDSIQKYKDGTYSTGNSPVSCARYYRTGKDILKPSDYGFLYAFVDNSNTPVAGPVSALGVPISVPFDTYNGHKNIVFKWYTQNTISDEYLVDRETVPIIEDAVDNLSIDLTNEMDGIGVGSNKILDIPITNLTTTATVSYGLTPQIITEKPSAENGGLTWSYNSNNKIKAAVDDSFIVNSSTSIKINITVDSGADFRQIETTNLYITLKTKYGYRTATYTLSAIAEGKDGVLFRLIPSTNSVSISHNNDGTDTITPSAINFARYEISPDGTSEVSTVGYMDLYFDGSTTKETSARGSDSYITEGHYNGGNITVISTDKLIQVKWFNGSGILLDSETVHVVRDGVKGDNGYSASTIYLYRRSSTALTDADKPNTDIDYRFSTGIFSNPHNITGSETNILPIYAATPVDQTDANITKYWWLTVPSGGTATLSDPVYITSVTIRSNEDVKEVLQGSWSTPQRLTYNGLQGKVMRGINEWSPNGLTDGRGDNIKGYLGMEDHNPDANGNDQYMYYDVVYYGEGANRRYYYCRTGYIADPNNTDYIPRATDTDYWVKADQFNFVATNVLFANNAHIDVQSSNALYMKGNINGTDYIVAGVQGGTDVNFFAGTQIGQVDNPRTDSTAQSTIGTAPFRVTYDGKVYVKGSIEADGDTNFVFNNTHYAIRSNAGLLVLPGQSSNLTNIRTDLTVNAPQYFQLETTDNNNGRLGGFYGYSGQAKVLRSDYDGYEDVVGSEQIKHLKIISSVEDATDNDTIYFIEG